MNELEPNVQLYAEYHAQIVIHCKECCRKKPRCENCPLQDICPHIGMNDT